MTAVEQLVIAGWTGRDEAALRKHIRELEEIGRQAAEDDADLLSRRGRTAHHR